MTSTIVIQIGNSDDKLTQGEWSEYWKETCFEVDDIVEELHFGGSSHGWAPWQNHCWVGVIKQSNIPVLLNRLKVIREKYRQDSVAITVGTTEFI